jgi:hypothetical protein
MLTSRSGAVVIPVIGIAAVAGVLYVLGPAIRNSAPDSPARAIPAPRFTTFSSASRAEIVSYARSLSFATGHGFNDTRRLAPSCPKCSPGPIATIDPEVGTHLTPMRDLAGGRVIGRWISRDSVRMSGLAPFDTTYIWVDSVQGRWRAVLVPTKPQEQVVEEDFVINGAPGYSVERSTGTVGLAR